MNVVAAPTSEDCKLMRGIKKGFSLFKKVFKPKEYIEWGEKKPKHPPSSRSSTSMHSVSVDNSNTPPVTAISSSTPASSISTNSVSIKSIHEETEDPNSFKSELHGLKSLNKYFPLPPNFVNVKNPGRLNMKAFPPNWELVSNPQTRPMLLNIQ